MKRIIALITLVCFLVTGTGLSARAQGLVLPAPGSMVSLSQSSQPVLLKGIIVNEKDPFRLKFIVDKGNTERRADSVEQEKDNGEKGTTASSALNSNLPAPSSLKSESTRLIKYFLAALTTPEDDMWVNLSPVEKDRIVPEAFGKTAMGRDLLAQDYLLKQITASLIHPDTATGKKFWSAVYRQAYEKFGTTDIPVETFNKVWITPETARIYTNANKAYIVNCRMKVLLEADYLAAKTPDAATMADPASPQTLAKNIMREVVLPVLTKEVNEGENFAALRQIYHSLILSAWFKRKMKSTLLAKAYADKRMVQGLGSRESTDSQNALKTLEAAGPGTEHPAALPSDDPERIWELYIQAYQKGVFNFIKEETDISGEIVPHKYFSGGFTGDTPALDKALEEASATEIADIPHGQTELAMINLVNPQAETTAQAALVRDGYITRSFDNIARESWSRHPDEAEKLKKLLSALFAPAISGGTIEENLRETLSALSTRDLIRRFGEFLLKEPACQTAAHFYHILKRHNDPEALIRAILQDIQNEDLYVLRHPLGNIMLADRFMAPQSRSSLLSPADITNITEKTYLRELIRRWITPGEMTEYLPPAEPDMAQPFFVKMLKKEFGNKKTLRIADLGAGTPDFLAALKPVLKAAGFDAEMVAVDTHWPRSEPADNLDRNTIKTIGRNLRRPEDTKNLGKFDLVFLNAPDSFSFNDIVRFTEDLTGAEGLLFCRFWTKELVNQGPSLLKGLAETEIPFIEMQKEFPDLPGGSELFKHLKPAIVIKRKGGAFREDAWPLTWRAPSSPASSADPAEELPDEGQNISEQAMNPMEILSALKISKHIFKRIFHIKPRLPMKIAVRHQGLLSWLKEKDGLPRTVDPALIKQAVLLHIDRHADISTLHKEPTSGNVVRHVLADGLVQEAWWASHDPRTQTEHSTYSDFTLFKKILRFSDDFPQTGAPVILSIDLDAFASSVENNSHEDMLARVERVFSEIKRNNYRLIGVFIATSTGVFDEEPTEPGYTRKSDAPILKDLLEKRLHEDYRLKVERAMQSAAMTTDTRITRTNLMDFAKYIGKENPYNKDMAALSLRLIQDRMRANDGTERLVLSLASGSTKFETEIARRNEHLRVIASDLFPPGSRYGYTRDFNLRELAAQKFSAQHRDPKRISVIRADIAGILKALPDASVDDIIMLHPENEGIIDVLRALHSGDLEKKLRANGRLIIRPTYPEASEAIGRQTGRYQFTPNARLELFSVPIMPHTEFSSREPVFTWTRPERAMTRDPLTYIRIAWGSTDLLLDLLDKLGTPASEEFKTHITQAYEGFDIRTLRRLHSSHVLHKDPRVQMHLKNIDALLCAANILFKEQRKESPLLAPDTDLKNAFENRDNPLYLEVGPADGSASLEFAAQNPGINVIGIEPDAQAIPPLITAIKARGLENYKVIFATDADVLKAQKDRGIADAIFVAGPSMKGEYAFADPDTIDDFLSLLKPEAPLIIVPDVTLEEYWENSIPRLYPDSKFTLSRGISENTTRTILHGLRASVIGAGNFETPWVIRSKDRAMQNSRLDPENYPDLFRDAAAKRKNALAETRTMLANNPELHPWIKILTTYAGYRGQLGKASLVVRGLKALDPRVETTSEFMMPSDSTSDNDSQRESERFPYMDDFPDIMDNNSPARPGDVPADAVVEIHTLSESLLPGEEDRAFRLGLYAFANGKSSPDNWRKTFDLANPGAGILLDPSLRKMREEKDAWDEKDIIRKRTAWLEKNLSAGEQAALKTLLAQEESWDPARAAWMSAYFWNKDSFEQGLKATIAALKEGSLAPYLVEKGNQVVLFALNRMNIDFLTSQGITVIADQKIFPATAGRIPLTVIMGSRPNAAVRTLNAQLTGTLQRSTDQTFWINMPTLVTGNASWMEAISSGNPWKHDNYDGAMPKTKDIAILTARLLALDHPDWTWEMVQQESARISRTLLFQNTTADDYKDLESATSWARHFSDVMHENFNTLHDIFSTAVRHAALASPRLPAPPAYDKDSEANRAERREIAVRSVAHNGWQDISKYSTGFLSAIDLIKLSGSEDAANRKLSTEETAILLHDENRVVREFLNQWRDAARPERGSQSPDFPRALLVLDNMKDALTKYKKLWDSVPQSLLKDLAEEYGKDLPWANSYLTVQRDGIFTLIDDLQTLANGDISGRKSSFVLDHAFLEETKRFTTISEETLRIASADGAVALTADRHKIMSILRTLIMNTQQILGKRPGKATVRFRQAGDKVQIIYEDTAGGFTSADNVPGSSGTKRLPPLLEVDETTGWQRAFSLNQTARIGGTGLGLAEVRHILALHGGYAQAENITDDQGNPVGARFIIELPQGDAAMKTPADDAAPLDDQGKINLDILGSAITSATRAANQASRTDFEVLIGGGFRYLLSGDRKDMDLVLMSPSGISGNRRIAFYQAFRMALEKDLAAREDRRPLNADELAEIPTTLLLRNKANTFSRALHLYLLASPYPSEAAGTKDTPQDYLQERIAMTLDNYLSLGPSVFNIFLSDALKDYVAAEYFIGDLEKWRTAREIYLDLEQETDPAKKIQKTRAAFDRFMPRTRELYAQISDEPRAKIQLDKILERLRMPFEKLSAVPSNAAMVRDLGGIDMNPKALNIEETRSAELGAASLRQGNNNAEQGAAASPSLNSTIRSPGSMPQISGLVPVILDMRPIGNLRELLIAQ